MVRIFIPLLLLMSLELKADVLFEGYYKILINEQHRGFSVARYEFDPKSKQFIATTFFKLIGEAGSGDITESLKATSDEKLKPLSYEFTSIAGKESTVIDMKFKKSTMLGTIKKGKKTQKINQKIPEGTFLSTFLVYVMLQSKNGIQPESNYNYQAIAEEAAKVFTGSALVGKVETYKGIQGYKILNTYNQQKFISYVSGKGEVLGTDAIGQSVRSELVASSDLAMGSFPKSQETLNIVFGSTPAGDKNIVSINSKAAAESMTPSKKEGVPPGSGMMLKTEPSSQNEKQREEQK